MRLGWTGNALRLRSVPPTAISKLPTSLPPICTAPAVRWAGNGRSAQTAAILMLGGNGSSRPLLALPDQPATGGHYQKAALDAAGRMRKSPIFTRKERHICNGWPIVTSLIAFTRSPYDTLGTKSFVPAKWAVGPLL